MATERLATGYYIIQTLEKNRDIGANEVNPHEIFKPLVGLPPGVEPFLFFVQDHGPGYHISLADRNGKLLPVTPKMREGKPIESIPEGDLTEEHVADIFDHELYLYAADLHHPASIKWTIVKSKLEHDAYQIFFYTTPLKWTYEENNRVALRKEAPFRIPEPPARELWRFIPTPINK